MTHEKNMIDYLDEIEHDTTICEASGFNLIMDKKDFLKSPPKLGDFIPTNEKGEVMVKPIGFDLYRETLESGSKYDSKADVIIKCEQFQSALDRVLWKGWEVNGDHVTQIINGKQLISKYDNCWDESYEQLITSGIKLERIQRK